MLISSNNLYQLPFFGIFTGLTGFLACGFKSLEKDLDHLHIDTYFILLIVNLTSLGLLTISIQFNKYL